VSATAGAGAKGGTLNYAEAGDFNDFNPWGFGAVNFEMYDQVFSRLLWKDGTGKANPDLGASWETASDNHSFTVKLRPNAKWQDGKPVTAGDFVTMYGYLKDPVISKYTGAQKMAGLFAPIKAVTAVDDATVQFSFDTPFPYITDILDYFFLIRIDDPNDPKFLKKLPVGTGPFTMSQWTPSQFAKFDRFSGYFQPGEPALDTFMFKRLSQGETLVPNLRSGAVQDILVASPSDVGPLKSDSAYQVTANENSGSIFNVIVNIHKPPFDNDEAFLSDLVAGSGENRRETDGAGSRKRRVLRHRRRWQPQGLCPPPLAHRPDYPRSRDLLRHPAERSRQCQKHLRLHKRPVGDADRPGGGGNRPGQAPAAVSADEPDPCRRRPDAAGGHESPHLGRHQQTPKRGHRSEWQPVPGPGLAHEVGGDAAFSRPAAALADSDVVPGVGPNLLDH
jgi:hypothetical protein